MQEKLLVFWQMIEPRLRIIIFAVFLALLAVIFFLKTTETSGIPIWNPPPMPPIPEDPAAVQTITRELYPTQDPAGQYPYSPLAVSMFNLRNVQDEVQKEETVKRLHDEAQALARSGQYQLALRKCEEALAIRPNFLSALNLKKTIEERLAAAAAPAATTP